MHRGSNGHHTCESTGSQEMNELWTCQKTTTEQFLLDDEMSLQGKYLDTHRGLQEAVKNEPADSHEHRRHAKQAVAPNQAKAAVPCLADSE